MHQPELRTFRSLATSHVAIGEGISKSKMADDGVLKRQLRRTPGLLDRRIMEN